MSIAELIKAVEEGTADSGHFMTVFVWRDKLGLKANGAIAWDAYNGSLDAAMALHKALLPGWWATFRYSTRPLVTVGDVEEEFRAEDDDLARAWLLAILRAKETGQ